MSLVEAGAVVAGAGILLLIVFMWQRRIKRMKEQEGGGK